MQIIDLVDSVAYTTTNCFAHQLHASLSIKNVRTVPLSEIHSHSKPDAIVCRLKQRTLCRVIDELSTWAQNAPMIIFDQDPWEAYRDGSPYVGTYERTMQKLNVKSFALTTEYWVKHLISFGIPSTFVNMWVLPEYCNFPQKYEDRSINVGFVGGLHPHRKQLFLELEELGIQVNVQTGSSLPYQGYLRALSNIKVFVHNEDYRFTVAGYNMSLRDAMWIKDVESASQGCFSVRDWGGGIDSYFGDFPVDDRGRTVLRTYKDTSEIPGILADIENMNPLVRQDLLDRTVEFIRRSNKWQETAVRLTTF